MSDTIRPDGKMMEWREREIYGGSTQKEMRDFPAIPHARVNVIPRELTFEDYLRDEEQRIILRERARIAQAMKRCPLVSYEMRQPLLDIIFKKE